MFSLSCNAKTRSCRFQWRKLQDHGSFIFTGFRNLKMHFDAYGYFLTSCMMSHPTRSSFEGLTGDALVKVFSGPDFITEF
jgi:hypothetical protein